MARCLRTRGCCHAPHLHATPPAAEERAPEPLPALPVVQLPATRAPVGHASPEPWEGGCVPPAEATGSSGCHSPVASCSTPWSGSAFPRLSWRAPGLPAPSTGCSPLSHQPCRVAGHQGQPHHRAGGASAGPETALSPPHPWGPPHQGWRPLRVAAPGPPPCPIQSPLPAMAEQGSREQGGTPRSCLPQPRQGKAQPSGKWTGPAPSTSCCLGAASPEGAARSRAESLSRDGKYHPGQICLHSLYSREAAERAGPGSRTLGLPTQFLGNSKGGF